MLAPVNNNQEFRCFKLVVAYDGTRFKGWQRGNGRTVQGVLEEALAHSVAQATRGGPVPSADEMMVVGAGRTDAGVHAEGQVASIRLPANVDGLAVFAALNRNLPADIAALSMTPADDRFHARYLARQKTYRLSIVEGAVGDPFMISRSWRINETLDLVKMREASAFLVGEKDFSSFTADKAKKNKIRNLSSVHIDRETIRGASRVNIVFRSDGFLWNQVRIMAAALVLVGRGEWKPAEPGRILDTRDRSLAPPPAPARALTLVSVEYDHA